ncbi:MAG TPA: nucleotide exchange factor GrpE [Beijerinckiaceae bacterium]|jgi:molecular chaperone GrpE
MKPDDIDPKAMPNGDAFPSEAANDLGAPGAGPDAPDAPAFQPEPDPVATLEAEKADLRDKLLRTLADMENMRRRTEREVADARAYGIANFARDMLTVADNFQRAIDNVPAEAREGAEPAFKTLIEGIELTERDMLKALERHGVKRLEPKGQKFDPNLHQAMFEVPDPSVPSGTVVQVVQTGYVISERVLRPALVGVAKGGPKAAPAEAPAAANGSAESAATGK